MSHLLMSQVKKHIEVLERKLEGDDVTVLSKELSSAKAYASVVTDGRVKKTIDNRVKSLEERIANASPDKSLVKIHDNAVMLVKLMETHPNYAKKVRKARKKSK